MIFSEKSETPNLTDYLKAKPDSVVYYGDKKSTASWRLLYFIALKLIATKHPDELMRLERKSILGDKIEIGSEIEIREFSHPLGIMRKPDGKWLFAETDFNAHQILLRLKKLMEICKDPLDTMVIYFSANQSQNVSLRTDKSDSPMIRKSLAEIFRPEVPKAVPTVTSAEQQYVQWLIQKGERPSEAQTAFSMTEKVINRLQISAKRLFSVTSAVELKYILSALRRTPQWHYFSSRQQNQIVHTIDLYALGQNYRNLEDARKDLANRFKYQRIPFTAVEDIQKPWYPALKALRTLSLGKVAHLTADERNADAAALRSYGKSANDFLTDSKPTLADILDDRDVNCTAEELDAIYSGLKSTPFDATLTQFNHLLDQQVARIGQARNRSKLKALWESVTGKESVKAWCDSFSTPIFWVIPKELRKPIHTVIDLQSGITTPRDTEVIAAIDALQNEKARVLTDAQKVYAALYETIGSEYVTYFKVHRPELLARLKLSHGNDMSTWEAPELSRLQSMMKSAIQQQARQEKLQNTKNEIAEMPVSRLRENIASFLDSHPEYCDEFLK